jgi:predicted DCC family thiol-disulfide oxidoreductase YuxK
MGKHIQNSGDSTKGIIIFDGVCHLCESSVQFIIKRDVNQYFIFTPLQSDYAQLLLKKYEMTDMVNDTIILIDKHQCFIKSDAAIQISQHFEGAWAWLRYVAFVPKLIRDFFYSSGAQSV